MYLPLIKLHYRYFAPIVQQIILVCMKKVVPINLLFCKNKNQSSYSKQYSIGMNKDRQIICLKSFNFLFIVLLPWKFLATPMTHLTNFRTNTFCDCECLTMHLSFIHFTCDLSMFSLIFTILQINGEVIRSSCLPLRATPFH